MVRYLDICTRSWYSANYKVPNYFMEEQDHDDRKRSGRVPALPSRLPAGRPRLPER